MQAAAPETSRQATARAIPKPNEYALLQNYASDPKFKKYTQQVEKCLNSFDSVQEWADFISFLKQLLKTFQSYMQFKEIPRKLIVSKRLSQCLNPALPTGVHQRALDVYSHILAVLGSEGLKRDLALWSSGLFPFFQYAATSVKPTLLNLYDTHFLPLQQGLRPIMKSFIVALLPGLEEETGEYFDKVLGILDRLSATVSPSFFLQNIWLIMLTNPAARGTASNFLSRRLPTLSPEEDITPIVGRDVGLMIRAFAAALEDDNLLVRRAALDLLVTSLRLDSVSVKNSRAEDRAILMRAAYSVILRRDLALNRRLYRWLLGPDESTKLQDVYFRTNALELLRSTLEEEMFKPSTEYSESRPFKIFVSLLDKWEIGNPLTEVLVYNAFKAIKLSVEAGSEKTEDMVITASTLYEAVEPHTLWKQLLNSVILEILGEGSHVEAIRMVKFLLESFHVQDEEIQTIHLPIVFSTLSEIIRVHVEEDPSRASLASVREALGLQEEILRHIPHVALKQRPVLDRQSEGSTSKQGPLSFGCTVYGLKDFSLKPVIRDFPSLPFVTTFEDLVSLSTLCANGLLFSSKEVSSLRQVFSQSVLLIMRLLGRMDQRSESPFVVHWGPSQWLSGIIDCLEHPTATFPMVDRVISLAVALHQTGTLQPKLTIDNRSSMFKMVSILLRYLRPDCAIYHVRCVNLIWQLEHATSQPHIESIIAQSLASQSRNNHGAYEAFGVLWRLTDDSLLPGFKLRVPVMITLDTLKGEDASVRRIGETWMRCSLKSYLRVLDPILYDLLDPTIRRSRFVTRLNGKELQDFTYEGQLDQRLVNYLLETLLSIVRFGGQGFARITRTTQIRHSPHTGLIERAEVAGTAPEEATYMDVLVDLLIRLLKSEINDPRLAGMRPFNATTQLLSVELLQAVVARGEIDRLTLETIEAAVIGKLYFSVHTERLDLQNKLLHLLHSVISALTTAGPHQLPTHLARSDGYSEMQNTQEMTQDSVAQPYSLNPLLVQTLTDGIGASTNRPILQHWLDFVLMTIPQFHLALQAIVAPLIDCVCRQLQYAMADVVRARSQKNEIEDIFSSTTDAELTMLLHAIEKLLLLSLSKPTDPAEIEDDNSIAEKPGNDGSGLLGYVSTVFSSESSSNVPDEQLTARSTAYRSLHSGVSVLYLIWVTFEWKNPQPWTSTDDSLSYIYDRTRARCRRVLDHLFRAHSAEVLESIIDCWNSDATKPESETAGAFELVDVLTSSAQTVVHMMCESISCRLPVTPDKNRKTISNINLTDAILFRFLEKYVGQLEGPVAMQVWGRFIQLAKEVVGGLKDLKVQAFYTLRCLSVLADKVIQTTAFDDRRLRKELQETYGKLLDSCVLSISRLDQGTWIRRGTKDSLAMNGRESPLHRVASDAKLDEKIAASPQEIQKPTWGQESADQIIQYIASDAIQSMRKFLMDNDKILAACSNIVYYVIGPSLKGKTRALDLDPVTLELLREMSRISVTLKAWRSPIVEALNDSRFFSSTPGAGQTWRPIIRALIDTDKTAFPEMLHKVTTAPSANIFSNREYELLLQSLNLRRLSYVIFTGDKNQFLAQLPTVQEKLVDTLRNVSAPIVQSEVYLCVRVLLCRLSAHNLTSFWPVILTELYRLFEQVLLNVPSDSCEDLPLILAACKFLDLLLVLQTEEFQIHQWIFITDTVDAIYRPEQWLPYAMMDLLAEVANDVPSSHNSVDHMPRSETPTISTFIDSAHPTRKPMLNSLRQIESIRDLAPFFSSVSITSYESVYASGGNVDWDAIEKGLMDDMFEGR